MRRIICGVWILLFLGGFRDIVHAQDFGQAKGWKLENIQVGIRMGLSHLVGELRNRESLLIEYRNTPNVSYGFSVSSEILRNLETGIDFGYSNLMGDANGRHSLTAQYKDYALFGQDQRYNYKTNLYSATLYVNYHLPNFFQTEDKSFYFNPYISLGTGITMFNGNLYRDDILIYQIGKGINSKQTSAFNILGGFGMRYTFNQHLILTTEYNLNLVSTAALDVTPNYTPPTPPLNEAEKLNVHGLVGRFLIGLSWRFGYYDNSKPPSRIAKKNNMGKRKVRKAHPGDSEFWYPSGE